MSKYYRDAASRESLRDRTHRSTRDTFFGSAWRVGPSCRPRRDAEPTRIASNITWIGPIPAGTRLSPLNDVGAPAIAIAIMALAAACEASKRSPQVHWISYTSVAGFLGLRIVPAHPTCRRSRREKAVSPISGCATAMCLSWSTLPRDSVPSGGRRGHLRRRFPCS